MLRLSASRRASAGRGLHPSAAHRDCLSRSSRRVYMRDIGSTRRERSSWALASSVQGHHTMGRCRAAWVEPANGTVLVNRAAVKPKD
jgi:hypothetical protein